MYSFFFSFTLQCFHDDIYITRTINRCIAPFAFSTHIAALQRGATGNSLKFITKLLHFDGFYAAKTFEHGKFFFVFDKLNFFNLYIYTCLRFATNFKRFSIQ